MSDISEGIELTEIDELEPIEIIVAILLTVAAIFSTFAAWSATLIDIETIDYEGMVALVNRERTTIINRSEAIQNKTIYTYYLQHQLYTDSLEAQLSDSLASEEELARLNQRYEESSSLTAQARFFFPGQYLNVDGSYDAEREFQTRQAQSAREYDLESQPWFDEANANRDKIRVYNNIFTALATALAFYAVASIFHEDRRVLRFSILGLGVVTFVGSFAYTIYLQFFMA
ncbi:MAG: hypothetical protein ACOYLB_08695 [Phototrophicaceae bacterium]